MNPNHELNKATIAILHRPLAVSPGDFPKAEFAALGRMKFGKGTWDYARQQALLAGRDTSEVEAKKQRLLNEFSGSHATVRPFGERVQRHPDGIASATASANEQIKLLATG